MSQTWFGELCDATGAHEPTDLEQAKRWIERLRFELENEKRIRGMIDEDRYKYAKLYCEVVDFISKVCEVEELQRRLSGEHNSKLDRQRKVIVSLEARVRDLTVKLARTWARAVRAELKKSATP
jgi:hypothetical protein